MGRTMKCVLGKVSGAELSRSILVYGVSFCVGILLVLGMVVNLSLSEAAQPQSAKGHVPGTPSSHSEYVILFVLEGVGKNSLEAGPMPLLQRFVNEGAVTWSATNPTPGLRLPSVASIIMGLPIEKHGITWDEFDFARGYPRPATLFDYMDLSGGKDTAIFFMEESLYQLARPEPYIDYQMCGSLRPECTSETVVKYIRDYMVKGTSGEGYGRRISDLPHLLLVHLPEAGRIGRTQGWKSPAYRKGLQTIDGAMTSILDIYKDVKLFDRTTVFVTSITNGGNQEPNGKASLVPWMAWGVGVKPGHSIKQPVTLLDTGATVMRTLGLETYTEWDSQSIEEVFLTPRSDKLHSRMQSQ